MDLGEKKIPKQNLQVSTLLVCEMNRNADELGHQIERLLIIHSFEDANRTSIITSDGERVSSGTLDVEVQRKTLLGAKRLLFFFASL